MTFGPGIRAQVLEVVVRQAMAGAPWREICAGPMQVNNITEAEVEQEVSRRLNLGRGCLNAEQTAIVDSCVERWRAVVEKRVVTHSEFVEQRIAALYQVLQRQPPVVIRCSSPAALVMFLAVIQQNQNSSAPLRTSIEQLGDLFWSEQTKEFQLEIARMSEEIPQRILRNGVGHKFGGLYGMLDVRIERRAVECLSKEVYGFFRYPLSFELGRFLQPIGTIFNATLLSSTSGALRNSNPAGPNSLDAIQVLDRIGGSLQSTLSLVNAQLAARPMPGSDLDQSSQSERTPSRSHDPFFAANVLSDIVAGIWQLSNLICWDCARQAEPDKLKLESNLTEPLDQWMHLLEYAPWYGFLEDVCFVGSYPKSTVLDNLGRLSNIGGPSAEYDDGYELYAVDGIVVPKKFVFAPESVTVEDVERETNVAVRRVLMESYGVIKFLADSNAVLIDRDEFGELFRKELSNDEPLVMVCVTNSTMEPDGTYRKYFLRVPPSVSTAKEAVAWSFGMNMQDYEPNVQT